MRSIEQPFEFVGGTLMRTVTGIVLDTPLRAETRVPGRTGRTDRHRPRVGRRDRVVQAVVRGRSLPACRVARLPRPQPVPALARVRQPAPGRGPAPTADAAGGSAVPAP